jgi:pyruvate dehydrogenase E1 component
VPTRIVKYETLPDPDDKAFAEFVGGSGKQAVSTTMAAARMVRNLMRDKKIGNRIVPIIPDEARTFGMDALFKEFEIYAPFGQLYEPVDAALLLSYKEDKDGQVLEEGITEAGSMCSFTAAGTAYASWGQPMIPFYIFYSMFGFQRTGDLIWAAGDARARGFLLGATAGRTTLNGEGLQHEDGHTYEVAVIVKDGMRRMYGEDTPPEERDRFYYLTLYNENYQMPAMPEGAEEGIIRGIYRYAAAPDGPSRRATILFSGPAWLAATEAQQLLADEWDVGAELWSVTSYKSLREDALAAERWNRLHPSQAARVPYVTEALNDADGPFVAVTDFMKMVPDQISRWVPGDLTPLGTDGYGRSDTRDALRRHFEVDAAHIVVAVLQALGKADEVADAITKYGIDAEAPEPRLS